MTADTPIVLENYFVLTALGNRPFINNYIAQYTSYFIEYYR